MSNYLTLGALGLVSSGGTGSGPSPKFRAFFWPVLNKPKARARLGPKNEKARKARAPNPKARVGPVLSFGKKILVFLENLGFFGQFLHFLYPNFANIATFIFKKSSVLSEKAPAVCYLVKPERARAQPDRANFFEPKARARTGQLSWARARDGLKKSARSTTTGQSSSQ